MDAGRQGKKKHMLRMTHLYFLMPLQDIHGLFQHFKWLPDP